MPRSCIAFSRLVHMHRSPVQRVYSTPLGICLSVDFVYIAILVGLAQRVCVVGIVLFSAEVSLRRTTRGVTASAGADVGQSGSHHALQLGVLFFEGVLLGAGVGL